MRIFVTLLALFASTSVKAQELPAVPEGGLTTLQHGACEDSETKEAGLCVFQRDVSGNLYLTFLQDGEVTFIRKRTADGYVEIYTRGKFPL